LYRGALVTIHRDIPYEDFVRVLSSAPTPLGGQARARLEARGTEAWERRVLALEGLADTARRDALPVLLELARNAPDLLRLRALRALAALAERPMNDPCLPIMGIGGSGAGEWSREIRPLGRSCATVLKTDERTQLAGELVPLAADPDPDVRAEAVVTIGAIGSPASLELLRSLVDDPYDVPGATVCESSGEEEECRPSRPVADAARDAIASIEELEQYWGEQAAEAVANPETTSP
jgi:HEAT repeat protein